MLEYCAPPKHKTWAFFFDSLNSSKYLHSINANLFKSLFGSFFDPNFSFESARSISISAMVSSGSYSLIRAVMTWCTFPVGHVLSFLFSQLSLFSNDTFKKDNASYIIAFWLFLTALCCFFLALSVKSNFAFLSLEGVLVWNWVGMVCTVLSWPDLLWISSSVWCICLPSFRWSEEVSNCSNLTL